MSEIIYGRNPVIEALGSGKMVEKILIAEEIKGQIISEITALARRNNVTVERISKQKLGERAKNFNTQGIIAFVKSHSYASVEEILNTSKELNEPPLVALLDGIEDPHNLGAIIRSADGAGLHGIILPKRR
ncbi:23S rRNA (guanosine(2251)-2'-O)-methyltransferase RlmB, partial [candidate division KSB1 bacterium]|nr:23S rRNA (guanosine(2251)-2'-O)-methyltransferase RlmB [candidate division KSB1 bacterium]